MIIAIDGPAGAGKSTVAKILAQELGYIYIDTGAMYRALTLKALEKGISTDNLSEIANLAKNTTIDLKYESGAPLQVFLDGKDVSSQIRETRITRFVSDISRIKEVRQVMVKLQRKLGKSKDSVLDGRDIGTVVFPDADKKFFIDANFKERVNRRYKELIELGKNVTQEDIDKDLSNRDNIDSTREIAPLKKAEDAIYIDTTDLTIDEVVQKMLTYIKN